MENAHNSNNIVKANRSFKWNVLAELMAKLMAPLMNMILARFIAPEIFGIVASVSIVVTFAELFSEGGFSRYIIEKDFKDESEIKKAAGTANISTIAVSLLLFVAIAVFRNPLATLTNADGYGFALVLVSLQIPIYGFSSIQQAIAKRGFDFKKLAFVRVSSMVIRLVISVVFAVIGRGLEAIILGTVVSAAFQCIALSIIYKSTLSFKFSVSEFKAMFGVSAMFFAESFVSWLTASIDTFLIGKYFDQNTNGVYKNAFSTASSIVALVTAVYSSVMISLLSRSKSENEFFNKVLYKYQGLISYVLIPMAVGLLIYRDPINYLFFGEGWEKGAIVLGLMGACDCLKASTGSFVMTAFTAKGKPFWNVLSNVIGVAWTVLSFLAFANKGFETFVVVRSMSFVITSIFSLVVGFIVLKVSITETLKNILIPTLLSIPMVGIGLFFSEHENTFLKIGSIALCVFLYFLLFFVLRKKDFVDFWKMLLGKDIGLSETSESHGEEA